MTSDVVVLGGGPAGYACALRAADLGMSVVLVEEHKTGGTCLHRGCIPTRAMLHAASLAYGAQGPAQRWGISAHVDDIDMGKLVATRDQVVTLNHRAVEKHLELAGVQVVRARGDLRDDRTVVAAGSAHAATKGVVVATGSRPRPLRKAPFDSTRILSSDDALRLTSVPRSMLIVGGGAVGAEFSQIWRTFGSEVTIVEREPHLVPFEDEAVGAELGRALRRQGIHILTGARIAAIDSRQDHVRVSLTGAAGDPSMDVEVVVVAIGRIPNTPALLESDDDGYPLVGDWTRLQSSVPGVHVVGDLLPMPSQARAHVAFAEGMLAADALAGEATPGIDYTQVPRVTHGLVETACVGLSEARARAEGRAVATQQMSLRGVAKGLMLGEPGVAKIVYERDDVLGVHVAGPHASELIAGAATMTTFEASPLEASAVVHAHPTLAEAMGELYLAAAGRPLHHRPNG